MAPNSISINGKVPTVCFLSMSPQTARRVGQQGRYVIRTGSGALDVALCCSF